MVQWKRTELWYDTRVLIFQNSFSSCEHRYYQDVTSSVKIMLPFLVVSDHRSLTCTSWVQRITVAKDWHRM